MVVPCLKTTLILAVFSLGLGSGSAGVCQEASGSSDLEELRERVHRLEQALEEGAQASPTSFDVFWKGALRFETKDKSFKLKLGGRIQNDWAFITADNDLDRAVEAGGENTDDGVEFRRARVYLSGTLHDNVSFKAQYDFAGGDPEFKDVYLRIGDLPVVGGVMVGQFKEPFSLEELTSSNYVTFMERSLPNDAFPPGRNTGFMVQGNAASERLTWAAGVFRDTDKFGDGSSDGNYNLTARVTALPWYSGEGEGLLHLGMAYSKRSPRDDMVSYASGPEAHLAPDFVSTGNFGVDDVELAGAEFALVVGPVSLQSEYIMASNDTPTGSDPRLSGFYAFASWFLTGEHRAYSTDVAEFGRVTPQNNFGARSGGIGAIELAGRYSHMDLKDGSVSGGELTDYTAGLNWYLNSNTRIMLNYVRSSLDGVGDAQIFQMRFQVFF